MPNVRSRLLGLLPLLFLLMAFRQAPLVDPPPIEVPAHMSAQTVAKAIEISLIRRGWEPSNRTADGMDGVLHLRDHVARIHIAYDTHEIRISYVASTNLKFEEKDGRRLIHKNYLGWIQNLVVDIRANLVLLS